MSNFSKLLIGAGIGAGIMYILDPQVGNRRRSLARDKATRAWHKTEDAISALGKDIGNRAQGVYAGASSRVRGGKEITDDVLVERVRSKLGRYVTHPSSIEATANAGRVTLRGPVLEDEVDDVLRATWTIRGVSDVDNQLTVHAEAGDTPALQGTGRRPGGAWGFRRTNWSPTHRVIAGTTGAALAAVSATRRTNPLAIAAGLAGLVFALRGLTNKEVKRIVGLGAGRKAVTVHKTMHFDTPVETVWEMWDNYQNFPRFMSNVEEVRDLGNGRSHWVVKGPAGKTVEWDAVITKRIPNRELAWKTVPGSMIQHSGIVQFREDRDGSKVDIRLSYNPIAGTVGHVVASLFAADPKTQLDQDLQRMKTLVEGHSMA